MRSLYWKVRALRLHIIDRPERRMVGLKRVVEMPCESVAILKRRRAIMQAFLTALHRSTSREEIIRMASLLGWDLSLPHRVPLQHRMYALLGIKTALLQGLLSMDGDAVNTSVPLGFDSG